MNRRSLFTLLAMTACVAVVSGCSGGGEQIAPAAEVQSTNGDFEVTNSRNGQAIFKAQGLAPGQSVSGTVDIKNTGTLPGQLDLIQADIVDEPGRNGGLLSQALDLAVQDLARGRTIFSGPIGVLDDRSLGELAAGEARTYRFTATLPDRGPPPSATTGDNAYLGASVTVRYVWHATAPEGYTPAGTPGTGAPKVTFKVRTRRLFKRGYIGVIVRCDRPCRVTSWAKMPRLKKRAKQRRTRRRAITIHDERKAGRIRLKVSKRTRKRMHRKLMHRRRIRLRVAVQGRSTANLAASAPVTKRSRRVTIRRKRISRRRHAARALSQLRSSVPWR